MDKADKIIRFDDVCVNNDLSKLFDITEFFRAEGFEIIWGVSVLIHANCGERVFPKILNAYSDFRHFYNVDYFGWSMIESIQNPNIIIASHGLVHVDHRLLHYAAQEMSILISCSLLKSKIFVPPFNKWDVSTEQICNDNDIELVKFEDGWKCAEYNTYDPNHNWWYLHAREWTLEKIKQWYGVGR